MAIPDGSQSATDQARSGEETRLPVDAVVEPDWIDRLVELHVLAEHGDDVSARAAQSWLAQDLQARQVWDYIEHVRDQVHTAGQDSGEEPNRAALNQNPGWLG
jgi:hypothetical protein